MIEKYINKITCGDCYELIKDIPNKSVDCIYTDIPYDIDSGGGVTPNYPNGLKVFNIVI